MKAVQQCECQQASEQEERRRVIMRAGGGAMLSAGSFWWVGVFVGVVVLTLVSESLAQPSLENGRGREEGDLTRREKYANISGGWWSELVSDGGKGADSGAGQEATASNRTSRKKGRNDIDLAEAVSGSDHPSTSDWDTRYLVDQGEGPYQRRTDYLGGLGEQVEHSGTKPQAAGGLQNYGGQEEVEKARYDSLYQPFNSVLGAVGNHEIWGYDGDQLDLIMRGDVGVPLISTFEPDDAHIKAGPLYLEFIYAGAGVLYSDYTGDRIFPEGQEDGWMSILELGLRGSLKITDQFSITLATHLVYLPGINKIGFALNDGLGLGAEIRLNYEFYIGTWNFLMYNHFRVYTPSFFLGMGEQALQRTGRYSFGVNARGSRNNNYFDEGAVYFVNTVGIRGKTAFLWENWDLLLHASHSDYWTGFDFENPGVRDRFGLRMGANGTIIPFSPYISYDATSFDRWKSLYNTAYIGGRGRLTDNVEINARAGYLWSSNRIPERNSPLWRLGLTHQISADTWHSVWAGQSFESSDVTNESALVEYIRYQINHQFSTKLWAYAYAQFGKQEDLVLGTPETDREIYGGRVNYLLFDLTRISGAVRYEKVTPERAPAIVRRRWIYRATVEQQIYSHTTARFYYQFENQEGISNFDEHVLSLTVRRYF